MADNLDWTGCKAFEMFPPAPESIGDSNRKTMSTGRIIDRLCNQRFGASCDCA